MDEQLDAEQGSVLAVGLRDADRHAAGDCTVADSARSAIELLRMLRFDLVLTADHLPDMPVWQFVSRMRAAWPWQKWALVSSHLTEFDEVTARTLGVMRSDIWPRHCMSYLKAVGWVLQAPSGCSGLREARGDYGKASMLCG
jgi:CheY-like chemotaxis protein